MDLTTSTHMTRDHQVPLDALLEDNSEVAQKPDKEPGMRVRRKVSQEMTTHVSPSHLHVLLLSSGIVRCKTKIRRADGVQRGQVIP